MFLQRIRRRAKPPSERLLIVYTQAVQQVYSQLEGYVRVWERQSLRRRKIQVSLGLVVALLLSCLSVYYTATGHFLTRIHLNHHEHKQSKVGAIRRKPN